MEDYPGANLSGASQAGNPSQPVQGAGWSKQLLIILVITIVILGSLLAWYFLNSKTRDLQTVVPETTSGTLSGTRVHPDMFFVHLRYNPHTSSVTLQESGVVNGTPIPPLLEKPAPNPKNLIYKVEVISPDNIVLQAHWYSVPLGFIENPDGTLSVFAGAFYRPGAYIQISLPNEEILWTGKIE